MTPTIIGGQRIVRLRIHRDAMGILTMVTWDVVDLHATSRAKPLHHTLTRRDAAAWVTAQGWGYLGPQEPKS